MKTPIPEGLKAMVRGRVVERRPDGDFRVMDEISRAVVEKGTFRFKKLNVPFPVRLQTAENPPSTTSSEPVM